VSHLQVSAATTGNILQFAYTSTDATQAAQYANAFAQAYITYRNNTALAPLAAAAAERQHTISALEAQVPHSGSAQRAVLVTQIRDDALQLAQFQADQKLVSAGMVIGTAVPPSSPSSPKVTKTLLIAGVIGLVVGICLALIMEAMDARIKSPEELETRLRAPVLGVIPKFDARSPERSLATIANPRGSASEAYRVTAITLEHMTARKGLRVIMIVSPEDGGGASTTTANLGVVLAQAGHRVILVSADLRDPRLHLIFGLSNGHGLSTSLLEGTDAERLLKEAHIPNLYVLTAGPEPKDPAALLSSPATTEVLTTLRGLEPDFILVDTPAVLSASDAVILSGQVEGTVLTWNAEDFGAPSLRKAQERLEVAGANILGGIYSFDPSRPKKHKSHKRGGTARPEAPFVPRETRKTPVGGSRAEPRYDRDDSMSVGGRTEMGSSRREAPGRAQL
jgi:capsular exopolysaccharide synthesis family protein